MKMKYNKFRSPSASLVEKVIINCDKASANGDSNIITSPWGIFKMYRKSRGARYYSISGSAFFPNRGSLRIGTIKKMLRSLKFVK